jgi:DNA primase
MPQWVNFKEIRQQVSLSAVLFELYGLKNLTVQDGKAVGPCPVHGGDNPRAFHADLEQNIWHCFTGCQGGGNQLDFVAKKEGVSIRDAALKLQAHFLSDGAREQEERKPSQPDARSADRAPSRAVNQPITVQLRLYSDHPFFADQEIPPEVCEFFGIGYCRRGIMRGCIAIPIHNEDGQLIAYAGRRLKPQEIREHGKYKFPNGFHKDLALYNLHRALPAAQAQGLVLVEGYFQVFFLHQLGYRNVVATMGSSISSAQAELIDALDIESVTVAFSGDEAGRTGAARVKQLLDSRCTVRTAHLPADLAIDDLEPDIVRWLLSSLSGGVVSLAFQIDGDDDA